MVSFGDFQKIEFRVGEVISAENVEGSDKLIVLQVDTGGKQVQMVSSLKGHYTEKELTGRKIIVVTNLDPAKIRGIESEAMLMAAEDEGTVSLLTIDKDMPVGTKVF